MAEQYMSLADSGSPEDLTAYQGLEPGWYSDPTDPTMARFWDGTTLGVERHPVAPQLDASDGTPQLQHEDLEPHHDATTEVADVPVAQTAAFDVDDSDGLTTNGNGNAHDDSGHSDISAPDISAPDISALDREGVCFKCEQPGRYYDSSDWYEEIRDSDGTLVLMGSKYSDDMTCLECETELDSHHTERWIEVWAQKPRALATRKKSMSQSMQSSGAGK